jgi:hypothetical protein
MSEQKKGEVVSFFSQKSIQRCLWCGNTYPAQTTGEGYCSYNCGKDGQREYVRSSKGGDKV